MCHVCRCTYIVSSRRHGLPSASSEPRVLGERDLDRAFGAIRIVLPNLPLVSIRGSVARCYCSIVRRDWRARVVYLVCGHLVVPRIPVGHAKWRA